MATKKHLKEMTCEEAEQASADNLAAWAAASNTNDPAAWDAAYTLYINKEVEIKESRFGHGVLKPKPRPH